MGRFYKKTTKIHRYYKKVIHRYYKKVNDYIKKKMFVDDDKKEQETDGEMWASIDH
jgi:hypothetical protein